MRAALKVVALLLLSTLLLLLLLLFAAATARGSSSSSSRQRRRRRAELDAASACEVVCLWHSQAPVLNPVCDRSQQWSSEVPVEILEWRHIFGDVLVLPAKSLSQLRATLPPRVRVLIYNTNLTSLDFALAVEGLVRPRVSVVVSDERRERPDHLALGAPLVLRQYASRHWSSSWPAHVHQLPIFTHCWDGASPPDPDPDPDPSCQRDFAARSLDWFFAGTPKGDRAELCAAMGAVFPSHFVGSTRPEENARLYANARLVLNPRGDSSLECSRAYAAMRLGCVPVGKASAWEVAEAFGRLSPRCPLLDLYAESTEELLELATSLLLDAPRWTELSSMGRSWDAQCLAELKDKVDRACLV